jgi:hypothetical protein
MGLKHGDDPACRSVMKITTARELVALTLPSDHC